MKHFGWIFLFLLLAFLGDRLGGWLLSRQVEASQFRYSRLYDGRAKADILLLGNSRGLAFYQPYLEKITGKTTFNLSYNGLPMDLANALVQDYLDRYPAPQTLLLDITACDRENDALLSGFLPYAASSARLDALIRRKLPKVWWGAQVSSLFRYNNEVSQRALYYRRRSDSDWLLDRAIAPALAATVDTQHFDFKLQPYLMEQMAELVAAARAHGVSVQLVIGPYLPHFTVNNLDALKAEAERLTGLPVHDYRNALTDPAAFGDFMHPNRQGSQQYLDLLKADGLLNQ